MKKTNRYLANYLSNKFKKSATGASETELVQFLNERGWILYDFDSMIKEFNEWRIKEMRQKSNTLILS
jgi:hypothetical protein